MNFLCLLKGHDWQFGYNHGIPLGDRRSFDEIEKGFRNGSIYQVDVCGRSGCNAQSRIIDGKRVILKKSERQRP